MGRRYTKEEVYENRFYRIPKAFFKLEKYKRLSLEAKLIYGFLDDRRNLSDKNNWIDSEGHIFLIFTRKEIQEMTCLSDKPVTRAFKQLKEHELIEEVKQGINKPNLIYVCHIDFTNIEDSRTRRISDTGHGEFPIQESEEIRCNDTDLNKTNISETNNLYSLTTDNIPFFHKYNIIFLRLMGKDHPSIDFKNYLKLKVWVSDLELNGISISEWMIQINKHLGNLPKNNDGNILSFMKAKKRYFEVKE